MRAFIVIAAFLFLETVRAQNTTTPGTVTLMSTFESISVRAAFTGDANTNNTVTVQFRQTGQTTWINAYSPFIDRRSTVTINGTPVSNAANQNQGRGSIVGLAANTSYDVRVTWADPDGIVGSADSTNVISTKTFSPTLGGTVRWVDASAVSEGNGTSGNPWKTITNAIANSVAGDTITVKSGTYVPFTINKSGSSGAWFKIVTNGNDNVLISGGAINNPMTVSGNFWVVQGLQFSQAIRGINISSGQHDIFIQNCIQTNAVTDTANDTGTLVLSGSNSNIFVLSNSFTTFNPTITNSTAGLINNIDIQGDLNKSVVIGWNTLIGGWDAIGNRNNSGFNGNCENSDFCHNAITNCIDDTVEMDGLGPELRVWDNHFSKAISGTGSYGGSLLSDAGTYIGPDYVFRNYFYSTNQGGGVGFKLGHSSTAPTFFFHNTMQMAGGGGNACMDESGGGDQSNNKTHRNNIYVPYSGNVVDHQGRLNTFDYDVMYRPSAYSLCYLWNNTLTVDTFTQFQSGTGQEAHGLGGDPALTAVLAIPSTSIAINTGLLIDNFNTSDSAWPYSGLGPDIGAYEFPSGGPGVPGQPLALTVTASAVGELTLGWSAPATNGGSAITSYKVYRGTAAGSETFLTSVSGTGFTNVSLANATTFYYKVSAVNAVGEGIQSGEASATTWSVPPAPQTISAAAGDTQVVLIWTAPISTGGTAITNYVLYRGYTSGTETKLADLGNVLTYTDLAVTNNNNYFYQVAAQNAVGVGLRSAEVLATPSAPTVPGAPGNLVASAGNTVVNLTWSAPLDDGGSAIINYQIKRGPTSGGETNYTTTGSTSYSDSGLVNGVTVFYKLAAINAIGTGAASGEAYATPVAPSTVFGGKGKGGGKGRIK